MSYSESCEPPRVVAKVKRQVEPQLKRSVVGRPLLALQPFVVGFAAPKVADLLDIGRVVDVVLGQPLDELEPRKVEANCYD